MRRFLSAAAVVVLVVGLSHGAVAGDIGEFNESYDSNQNSSSSSSDWGDDTDDDSSTTETTCPSETTTTSCADPTVDCTTSSSSSATEGGSRSDDEMPAIFRLLVGATPGPSFSLGRAPYDGRGERASLERDDFSERAYAYSRTGLLRPEGVFDGRVTDHAFQWTFRSNALMTSSFDGFGAGLFAKLTSTGWPGFSVSYQYASEPGTATDLGLGYMAYEPNLLLSNRATLTWNAGVSFIHSLGGIGDLGGVFGASLEWFPLDPFMLGGRAELHMFPNVAVGDARGSVGIFMTDRVAVETSIRHLQIVDGAGLTTYGLGIRTYMGM